jgi:hypothetical protein
MFRNLLLEWLAYSLIMSLICHTDIASSTGIAIVAAAAPSKNDQQLILRQSDGTKVTECTCHSLNNAKYLEKFTLRQLILKGVTADYFRYLTLSAA